MKKIIKWVLIIWGSLGILAFVGELIFFSVGGDTLIRLSISGLMLFGGLSMEIKKGVI